MSPRQAAFLLPLLLGAVGGTASAATVHRVQTTADRRGDEGSSDSSVPLRSLWVWRAPAPPVLVGFAEATGIQRIYYSVSTPITNAQLLQDEALVSLAHGHHIQVLALGGKPSWGTAEKVSEAIAWENEVLSSGAAFDGIALDIEPADYSDDGGGQAFVAALEAIRANDPHVHLEMSQEDAYGMTPYGTGGETSLAAALDATGVNEVEIMSYRNNDDGGEANPNDQYGVALPDMEAAFAAGLPATLGAETSEVTPAIVTFFGMTYDAMQAVLARTDALERAGGFTNYRGISIEDYIAYRAMPGAPSDLSEGVAVNALNGPTSGSALSRDVLAHHGDARHRRL